MTSTLPPALSLVSQQKSLLDLTSLDPIAKGFSRRLRDLFFDMTGKIMTAACNPANSLNYPQWRLAQNPHCALLRFRIEPSGDEALLHLPGQFIGQLVDLHYGGSGSGHNLTEFTAAERRVIDRLGETLAPLLAATIEAAAANVRFAGSHCDLLQVKWPKSSDPIVVQTFTIEGDHIAPALLSLIITAETTRSLSQHSVDGPNWTASVAGSHWHEQMHAAAMQIAVPARTLLAQTTMPFHQMLTMAPGDILPLLIPSQIPLTVNGRTFALGSLGEANGHAALLIEKMEKDMNQ